jgi:hypothetical protein
MCIGRREQVEAARRGDLERRTSPTPGLSVVDDVDHLVDA